MPRFLLTVGVLAVISLLMLATATGYAERLSEHFWLIATFAGGLTLVLLIILVRQLYVLRRDAERQVFGAKLTHRLVKMFAVIALLPGVFVLSVSVQFISSSIDSWFGNETADALERSLNLSKRTLQAALNDTENAAKQLSKHAQTLLDQGSTPQQIIDALPTGRFPQILWYADRQQPPTARCSTNNPALPLPEADMEQDTLKSNISINNVLYAQVWQPVSVGGRTQYLFFRQPVAREIAADVVAVENARSKYAELIFAKRGLQTFFLMTLVMATLLAIMLAVLTAVFFAQRFVAPLMSLAQATQSVAQGDFSSRSTIYRPDEMGMLSARFNRMTEQLQAAREVTERLSRQQEEARRYLELVLASLSAGVMTLDEEGSLRTYNESALRILAFPLHELVGQRLPEAEQETDEKRRRIMKVMRDIAATVDNGNAVEIHYLRGEKTLILMGRAVRLAEGTDTVLVFDDITDLAAAQKEAAWGEVARRLAHEIRNPLTPIQLSAERLAWKLQDKLSDTDADILRRSTDTIVKQVGTLKEMVEDFRNYARSGSLKKVKTDLNEITGEILLLYEGSEHCRFSANLCAEPLWVMADHSALRQVLHNLLKNAAEAAEDDASPKVEIFTEAEDNAALLQISNNGKSFAPEILQKVFEPYVTNKKNGTGLGLAVVKKIIDEHGGNIALGNGTDSGAWLKITLPLTEK